MGKYGNVISQEGSSSECPVHTVWAKLPLTMKLAVDFSTDVGWCK